MGRSHQSFFTSDGPLTDREPIPSTSIDFFYPSSTKISWCERAIFWKLQSQELLADVFSEESVGFFY